MGWISAVSAGIGAIFGKGQNGASNVMKAA